MTDDTTQLRAAFDWLTLAMAAARAGRTGSTTIDRDRLAAIVEAARLEWGARIQLDRDPQVMRMAGITTSTTSGGWNLLAQWLGKARAVIGEDA